MQIGWVYRIKLDTSLKLSSEKIDRRRCRCYFSAFSLGRCSACSKFFLSVVPHVARDEARCGRGLAHSRGSPFSSVQVTARWRSVDVESTEIRHPRDLSRLQIMGLQTSPAEMSLFQWMTHIRSVWKLTVKRSARQSWPSQNSTLSRSVCESLI